MREFWLAHLLALTLVTKAASTPAGCNPVCELDALGQQLTFPYPIVSATVFATTTNIIYFQDLKGSQIISTNIKTAAPVPKRTFTWKVSGVTLTYPTTYVFYTKFLHSFFVEGGPSSVCQTTSSALALGNATRYSSLIYPIASITGTLPPNALVNYLESIPTVFKQLGGSVNSSCDPVSTSSSLSGAQQGLTNTLTTTNTLPGATITSQTVTVPAQFDSTSGSSLSLLLTTPRFRNTTTRRTTTTESPTSTTTRFTLSIAPISSSLVRGSSVSSAFASATSSLISSALSDLSTRLPGTGPSTSATGGFSNAAARHGNEVGVGSRCLWAALLGVALYWL